MGSVAKWRSQISWYVDPVNGSDDAKGDTSATPLKTLSEFHLRMEGAQPRANVTATIASDLNAGDDTQGHFLISRDGLTFQNYIFYAGVQRVVYSGTIDSGGYTTRNGATDQQTLLTSSGLTSTWTAGDGQTTFVGLTLRRTSDGSTARVVEDMGGKQAWISQPITASASPVTWAQGDAFTVYDVPSLGKQFNSHSGLSRLTDLKVSGRLEIDYGQVELYNFTGDTLALGSSTIYSQNGLSGIVSGASFLVSGGVGGVAGGYHRLICTSGLIRINVTATLKALQCEGGGKIVGISGGSQGTSDFEFCGAGTLNPFLFNGVSGGHIATSGYSYGTCGTSTVVSMQGRDALLSVAHVPNLGGSTGVSFTLAGTTASTASLSSQSLSDVNNNKVIGPFGP